MDSFQHCLAQSREHTRTRLWEPEARRHLSPPSDTHQPRHQPMLTRGQCDKAASSHAQVPQSTGEGSVALGQEMGRELGTKLHTGEDILWI